MGKPIYLFKKTANVELNNNILEVKNVRNHSHRDGKISQKYVDKKFDVRQLKETWLGLDALKVSAFSHIYFIFAFKNENLVVSVDAKRFTVQARPVAWGWLPIYPINYTLSTEKDIFEYRIHGMGRPQYLYKMNLTPDESRAFLLEIIDRMRHVQNKKIKFNSIFRNCNTEVLNSLRRAVPEKFNSRFKSIYVSWIDHYFYNKGLLKTKAKTLSALRKKHDITQKVKDYKHMHGDFSKWIRKDL